MKSPQEQKHNIIQIINRIKEAYDLKTDADLARFLGINPSTLGMQKNRGSLDWQLILDRCSDLNKNWLINGTGPMRLGGDDTKVGSYLNIPHFSVEHIGMKKIEDLSPESPDAETTFQIPEAFLFNDHGHRYQDTFTIRSNGDAHSPLIQNDDLVVIARDYRYLEPGSIYLCCNKSKSQCKLEQLNSEQLKRRESEIVGKVIWVGHLLEQ